MSNRIVKTPIKFWAGKDYEQAGEDYKLKKGQQWILVGLAALLSVFLVGCGLGGGKDDQSILRIRIVGDMMNLDPAFIVGGVDDTISRAVFDGLIRMKPDSTETENQLAEWIEVSDDGLEISFKLKEGVMWHKDYGELTTEDVKYSFERFLDKDLAAAYADDWAALDHVEIIDDYEGKIVLREAQATLWTTTLPLTSGLIVCKKQVEEIGVEQFATHIVGTGPYIFEEWMPNEKVVLKRNQDYWGEQPAWEEIHLIPIDDDIAGEVALESGEVDFSLISLASADRFTEDPDFEVVTLPSSSYGWLGMNVENPKLQDINVRQAIRYAVDVPGILEAAYLGKADQARSILPPDILGYWDGAPLYERDLEKARDYMARAGVSSLDLTLAVENTMEYRTWAEIIQQNLAEIGIDVSIQTLDTSAFWVLGEGDKGKEVELFTMTYTAMPDPAWFTMWFTSDQVGVWNWMRWGNAEFDELHKKGIATLDQDERAAVYIRMQELWDEAVHTVWITHTPQVYGYSPAIEPVIYPGGLVPMLREFRPSSK